MNNCKDTSEIAKNWATAVTLVAGLILTIIKGGPIVEEKKREIAARADNLKSDYITARIALFKETQNELPALIKKFNAAISTPVNKRDDAKVDTLEQSINESREKQLKILTEIKNALEVQQ